MTTVSVDRAVELSRDRDIDNYFDDCDPVSDFTPASVFDQFYADQDTFDRLWGDAVTDHNPAIMESIRTTLAQMKECADVIDPAFGDVSAYKEEMGEHAKALGHLIFEISRRYARQVEARYE